MSRHTDKKNIADVADISDRDILEAMKDIPGYIDITTGDFKELYRLTYRHALKRIVQSVTAGDIMTKEVVSVNKETPLTKVAKLMADQVVSGVPVIGEDEKVVGIISEKDFLSRMESRNTKTFMGIVSKCLTGKGCVALSIRGKNAEDIMVSPAITVCEDATILDMTNILKEKNINRLPVVDRNGHLKGIVSREDILEAPILGERY